MSMGNRPSFSSEVKLQWAGSRENNLASGRGRTFFLTSLFIELIDGVLRVIAVNVNYRAAALKSLEASCRMRCAELEFAR